MFREFLQKIFGEPLTMRVRHDSCIAKKPKITVVFLHGIAASSNTWHEFLPPLCKDKNLSKVRFVALDLIGFGKSEKPKDFTYDYKSYRSVLTQTLKKLKIHTPIILCGHSMGCLIAMDYAENGDKLIDQLILISPPIIKKDEIAGVKDQIYVRLYGELRNHTSAKIVGTIATFVDALSSFEKRSLDTPAFRKCMDNIILNENNYSAAVKLRIPMTVIHGRFDPLVIGANLHKLAERNKCFNLTNTFGGHDVVGAKAKKSQEIFKETVTSAILQSDL